MECQKFSSNFVATYEDTHAYAQNDWLFTFISKQYVYLHSSFGFIYKEHFDFQILVNFWKQWIYFAFCLILSIISKMQHATT